MSPRHMEAAIKALAVVGIVAFCVALIIAWTTEPTLGTVAVVGFCWGVTFTSLLVHIAASIGRKP